MRLNRFDTSKIKVRSSQGGGRRMRGAGGVGCGTIVIAIIAALIFGVDPMQAIGVIQGGQQQSAPVQTGGDLTEEQVCNMGPYANEACAALTSLNETWEPIFARSGVPFEQPTLDLYRDGRVMTQGWAARHRHQGRFTARLILAFTSILHSTISLPRCQVRAAILRGFT